MSGILVTPYDLAVRYVGMAEIPGEKDHPFVQWCFSLCGMGLETDDEVPWCSAFLQHPFWELGLERSGSARARSWLKCGMLIDLSLAQPGFDIVVFKRGVPPQPGPEVGDAPGHVGLFHDHKGGLVYLLGGNQGNRVSVNSFPEGDVLSVRRVA